MKLGATSIETHRNTMTGERRYRVVWSGGDYGPHVGEWKETREAAEQVIENIKVNDSWVVEESEEGLRGAVADDTFPEGPTSGSDMPTYRSKAS